MGSPLPLSSLRLLVPPLRLMSAFMWQVVQQQKLEHYNKLEEYILLLTKMVPEILSDRQKTALVMGLRAKSILEMCKGEVPIDLETIKARLYTIQSKATGSEVESLQCRLLKLLLNLLEDPVKKEHFFQKVYPLEYGLDFDKALQVLVGHFLSRLEQLLPVPNFKQAASWLSTEPTVWENVVQTDWNPKHLQPLLQSDYQGALEINGLPSVVEERVISTLSLPFLTSVGESNTNVQAKSSLSSERSFQRNQDLNQDIIQTVKQESDIDNELSTCIIQEDVYSTQNDIESLMCDIGVRTIKTELESVDDTTEVDGPESEVSAEVDEPEPNSMISCMHSDWRNVSEDDEAADATDPEQLLKVVVTKHMIPVIKVGPSTNSESGAIKVEPEIARTEFFFSEYRTNTGARNIQQGSYICSQCGMSYRCMLELRAHMQKHNEESPYKCQLCKLNFRSYFQASVHQRRWHNQVTYSCCHCSKSFRSLKALIIHRKEHQYQAGHRCTDCGQVCGSLQALVNHSKDHNHLLSERLPHAHKCIACGIMFSEKTDFMSHMETHKVQDRLGNQKQVVKRTKCLPGECRFCGRTFNEIELRMHLKTHPEFRPHQCDHCGKCFASLHGMLAHMSNHTGEKPHDCLKCGKKFFSTSQLKSHMKSHSKERLHCCSYCGKCFHSLGNLNIHMRRHTGEKPYVCPECGKAFISTGCLQVHLRCHTGEKPYSCNICGQRFVVSSHRTIHMRKHTGHRPYVCQICGKSFIRKRCLDEHMYSHTEIKPFSCSICSKSFTRRPYLNKHMQSHSKDQSSENVSTT